MGDRMINALFRAYVVLSVLFILTPILTVMAFSLNINRHPRLPWGGFSSVWYEAAWNDHTMTTGLQNSVIVAVCVSVIATFIGFATAYTDYRFRFLGKTAFWRSFSCRPRSRSRSWVWCSWSTSRRSVCSASSTRSSSVTSLFSAPFAMALIRMRLAQMDENLEAAAWNLGAGEWTTIREIILPYTRPSIIAALFITMAVSFDEYMIAWFVSGMNETLPARILAVLQGQVTPQINAVGSIVFVISIVLVLIAQLVLFVRRPQSGAPK